jgi:hypothetical protein
MSFTLLLIAQHSKLPNWGLLLSTSKARGVGIRLPLPTCPNLSGPPSVSCRVSPRRSALYSLEFWGWRFPPHFSLKLFQQLVKGFTRILIEQFPSGALTKCFAGRLCLGEPSSRRAACQGNWGARDFHPAWLTRFPSAVWNSSAIVTNTKAVSHCTAGCATARTISSYNLFNFIKRSP